MQACSKGYSTKNYNEQYGVITTAKRTHIHRQLSSIDYCKLILPVACFTFGTREMDLARGLWNFLAGVLVPSFGVL